ncbi:TauD/TfdA family dioxygenase [Xenorhabdus sp. XENO-10]|uniref:TauD/TfdA family dioxygenase n=1 Tax=Xenorhabdus yunnanensis TaxID=3025878 RepID=A0ABT5LCU2_9GAMM|nr:TauD/TfdA family dioxygenase [Xenorhabdus yunnanensis]MDC9588923.1 TauD/TfdA family dioxygenase [Xenorhabdus yunnanensis]
MPFTIKPLRKHFGAYVVCENFSEMSNEDYIILKSHLSTYGLLIFNNQKMNDEDLVNFAQHVGSGKLEEPARKISLSDNRKYIAYLTNLRDNKGEQLGFAGNETDFWHSDQEFRFNPASVSILYSEVVKCQGGNTSFVSTAVDHLEFTPDELSILNKLWSTRQPAASHDNAPHITVAHPVIIENVRTKQQYIYVSENTMAFLDNNQLLTHSKELKETILEKILSPENIYSHQWSEGDLLLYDNSQLLHRREYFTGDRFIKALKIHPDTSYQTKIPGREIIED